MSKPNMQGIFPRTPEGKLLRHAAASQFGPPPLIDYSEVEARVLAHFNERKAPKLSTENGIQRPTSPDTDPKIGL